MTWPVWISENIKMKIKVLVATHKSYNMPDDAMYFPIIVGASAGADKILRTLSENTKKNNFICDNTGENISEKNPFYCELTALYWGWKNLDADYLGLVHYRRYFMKNSKKFDWNNILDEEKAIEIFSRGYKAIVPQKRHYVIESVYDHYIHSHHEQDLIVTSDVIHLFYPEYIDEYVKVMGMRSAHMFNMFIMERACLNDYCIWLFDVLAKIEERLDITEYSDFDKRVFGRISELLLDVWMLHNNVSFKEIPVRNTEGEQLFSKALKVIKNKIKRKTN